MFRYFLTILILFSSTVHATNPTIDSLKRELNKNISPKKEILLNRNIGREYYKTQKHFDSAYYYSKVAYDIANKEGLEYEKVISQFHQALVFRALGELDVALELYNEILVYANDVNNIDLIASTINNIGDIYLEKKDYTAAKSYFNKLFILAENNNLIQLKAMQYLHFAEINYYEGKFNDSKNNILKSEHLFDSLGIKNSTHYYLLAKTYFALEEYNNAEITALVGYEKAINGNDMNFIDKYNTFLFKYYSYQRDFNKAIKYANLHFESRDSISSIKKNIEIEKILLHDQIKDHTTEIEKINSFNKYLKISLSLSTVIFTLLVILIFRLKKIKKLKKRVADTETLLDFNIVNHEITDKKLYKKIDLTLQDVSKGLEDKIHSKRISQVINLHSKKNFSKFINSLRVDEAKIMLVDQSFNYLTIEGIGNEAGFNSRSAFYNAFKAETNMTPSEYKKQVLS